MLTKYLGADSRSLLELTTSGCWTIGVPGHRPRRLHHRDFREYDDVTDVQCHRYCFTNNGSCYPSYCNGSTCTYGVRGGVDKPAIAYLGLL
eukprot:7408875-Pyramimonas_sp.AAC.1